MATTAEEQKHQERKVVLGLDWLDIGAFGFVLVCMVLAIIFQSISSQIASIVAALAGGVILAAMVNHARGRREVLDSLPGEYKEAQDEAAKFRELAKKMKKDG